MLPIIDECNKISILFKLCYEVDGSKLNTSKYRLKSYVPGNLSCQFNIGRYFLFIKIFYGFLLCKNRSKWTWCLVVNLFMSYDLRIAGSL